MSETSSRLLAVLFCQELHVFSQVFFEIFMADDTAGVKILKPKPDLFVIPGVIGFRGGRFFLGLPLAFSQV